MITSKSFIFPQSNISKLLNCDFKFSAFFLVLLLIIIFETFIFFKAKIIEGTTPPAPKIKIFLPSILKFKFLIALVKPAISVLCPTKLSLFKIIVFTD